MTTRKFTSEEQELIDSCDVEIVDYDAFFEYHKFKRKADQFKTYKSGSFSIEFKNTNEANFWSEVVDIPEDIQDKAYKRFKIWQKFYTNVMNRSRNAFGATEKKNRKNEAKRGLLADRKMELVELFGRMYTPKESLEYIRETWKGGRDITLKEIRVFYTDNLELINREIESHRTDFSKIRLVAKKSRLEELTWMGNIMKRKISSTQSREDIKVYQALLEQIRKEVEGERLKIEGDISLNVKADVNVHLRQELLKDIPLREIIIARVASRAGLNPLIVISDLNNSYYAKVNTMINGGEYVDFTESIGEFPSQKPYDFDVIKSVNQQSAAKRADLIAANPVTIVSTPSQDDIKRRLLAKLAASTTTLQTKQGTIKLAKDE